MELRELPEFVLEVVGFEEYLCSKFEEGLNLEIRENTLVSDNQDYKQVVPLTLRAEKLTNEQVAKGKLQKMKGFGFMSGQSSKKSRSSESLDNSSRLGIESISSPQTV